MTKIISIVGNPKAQSKTSKIAAEISKQLGERLENKDEFFEYETLELTQIASNLFEWGSEEVQRYIDKTLQSDIIIVASPTYKATYTGLLKAFLDQIPQDGLNGKITIPVMIGVAPQHSIAIDAYLTPLLLELGASCTFRGLYVLESDFSDLSNIIKTWLDKVTQAIEIGKMVSKK